MLEWLRGYPWSLGDVLALAGVVATVAVAVIGPVSPTASKVRARRLVARWP